MVILNRIDMADPDLVEPVERSYFKCKGHGGHAAPTASRTEGINTFASGRASAAGGKAPALRRKRDRSGRPLKLMVVGIPNVGKSTFINQIAGRKGAKAENRPGVTRGKQWVNVDRWAAASGYTRHPLAANLTTRRSACALPTRALSKTIFWIPRRWPAI